ncbi:MAG: hypothetical protein HYZ28_12005 [Myxococcales bacterium]|nr:hypothetical protein [Myxococcales bacterium]
MSAFGRWLTALSALFSGAALACPACAGRDEARLSSYLVWGMMLVPFAVALAAVRLIRKAAADRPAGEP